MQKGIAGIKNIIWDWNGTLLDDMWLCLESINELLTTRGKEAITAATYHQIFGFPVRDYYERAGFDFTNEAFKKPALQFIELYDKRKKECRLHEGSRETLAFFSKQNINQYILSASETLVLTELIEYHGLSGLFNGVYGLDNHYADGKAGLAKIMVNDLNLVAGETVLIGDTCHDYEVARQVGWQCILYTGGHYAKNRLIHCGTTLAENLAQLRKLINPQHT